MIKIPLIVLFLFLTHLALSQPKFKNDTLYTSSGYKIYKGQTLEFGSPTSKLGRFRFINIKSQIPPKSLANNTIVVKQLKNFGISVLDNGYIDIVGAITYRDGSKGLIKLHMAFDRAIENSLELPSELIVPLEFRNIPELKNKKTEKFPDEAN